MLSKYESIIYDDIMLSWFENILQTSIKYLRNMEDLPGQNIHKQQQYFLDASSS